MPKQAKKTNDTAKETQAPTDETQAPADEAQAPAEDTSRIKCKFLRSVMTQTGTYNQNKVYNIPEEQATVWEDEGVLELV